MGRYHVQACSLCPYDYQVGSVPGEQSNFLSFVISNLPGVPHLPPNGTFLCFTHCVRGNVALILFFQFGIYPVSELLILRAFPMAIRRPLWAVSLAWIVLVYRSHIESHLNSPILPCCMDTDFQHHTYPSEGQRSATGIVYIVDIL